jgi:hypothetical protein
LQQTEATRQESSSFESPSCLSGEIAQKVNRRRQR